MNSDTTLSHEPDAALSAASPLESDSASDSSDDTFLEKWADITDIIQRETIQAYPSSPVFNPEAPEPFQVYWNAIFSQISNLVAENPSIPYYLTEPPVKEFQVRFFDQPHAMCCPCSLPMTEPSIHLRNKNGVTKEDLMRELTNALYGNELPHVWNAERQSAEGKQMGGLVYWSDWMSQGSFKDEQIAYLRYTEEGHCSPQIILYFSTYENFTDRVEFARKKIGKLDKRDDDAIKEKL